MGTLLRFIPLLVICLLVFTEPGQQLYSDVVDWGSEQAAEWFQDTLKENEAQRDLRERLRGVEPVCDAEFKPDRFEVSGSEAIALAAGKREVDCDLVDLEPMFDAGYWSVHFEAIGPKGCEFSAEVDATTGEVSNRFRDCPREVGFVTHANGAAPQDALVGGRLVFRDNCFYVDHIPGAKGGLTLPVWPHGFTYRGDERSARIVDQRGTVIARVGDRIVGGGMVGGDEIFPGNAEGCHGPYWMMGPVVERRSAGP